MRVRDKGYRNLKPLTPGHFRLLGAAQQRSRPSSTSDLLDDFGAAMDMRSRACTPRPAPACSRRRIRSTTRWRAADKAALFKTFTKVSPSAAA